MAKISIPTITSGFASVEALNTSLKKIEDELNNKVLYRDNPTGEPNQMRSDLDMNGNYILNVLGQSGEGFIWKDSWVTATSYNLNNLIKYNGDCYICKKEHTSGNWATDLADDKWGLLIEKPTAIGGGDLIATNNLSDVDNFEIARANLLSAKSGDNSDITSLSALNEASFKSTYNMEAGVDYLGYVVPGASGNVLKSNGTSWYSDPPKDFPVFGSKQVRVKLQVSSGTYSVLDSYPAGATVSKAATGKITIILPISFSSTNYNVQVSTQGDYNNSPMVIAVGNGGQTSSSVSLEICDPLTPSGGSQFTDNVDAVYLFCFGD